MVLQLSLKWPYKFLLNSRIRTAHDIRIAGSKTSAFSHLGRFQVLGEVRQQFLQVQRGHHVLGHFGAHLGGGFPTIQQLRPQGVLHIDHLHRNQEKDTISSF